MRLPVIPFRLRRLPLLWWLSVVTVATVAGLGVAGALAKSAAAADRFDGLVPVLVATVPLGAGHVVGDSDVTVSEWPRALLPASAPVDDPRGRTVVNAVDAGQPLTEANVGRAGLGRIAAQLEEGERAVAVPAREATPPLETGDRVDLLATFDAVDKEAVPVAVAARVVANEAGTVTVAVSGEEARRVAFAAVKGSVTIVATAG